MRSSGGPDLQIRGGGGGGGPDPETGAGRSQKQFFRPFGPQLVYNSATKKVGDERCGTKVESETNLGKRIREIRSFL